MWLLELRRVLRSGARLYVTIHDHKTIELFEGLKERLGLARYLTALPLYRKYISSEFGTFTFGRSIQSQVFYDIDYFREIVSPFFRVVSVNEQAYGYQTAVLLERL